jgi:hypothetical protein
MNQTTTECGACKIVWEDGSEWTTERERTRVDDWRETPAGLVNFGYVTLGPTRIVQIQEPRA